MSQLLSDTKLADLPGFAPGDVQAIELQVGQLLGARYEIQALIGRGGMGAVYQARDRNTDRDIALKVLLPSLLKNERAKQRFLSEAKISQQLSHPHIVNVFDVQQDGELFFLTMELLEGQDLRQVLRNRQLSRQVFSEKEMRELLGQLAPALDYAHKFTVHRDIKPENIWLTDTGDYKLMDFGIAQVQSTSQRTTTGAAMGTAYYMAPEQLRGQQNIDGRADVYALGVLLYEMATGEVPAGIIKALDERRRDLSKGFCRAVMGALQNDPADRPAKGTALLEAAESRSAAMSARSLVLAASIVVGVGLIGGLAYSGALSGVVEALKPVDRDVLVQQQADATRMLGEIRNLSTRLDNSLRTLERDVADAAREGGTNLARLREWESLARQHISESSELTRLQGELTLGETLLRDEAKSGDALASLTLVREGYQQLLESFNAIGSLLEEQPNTQIAAELWQSYRAGYEFADPPSLATAQELLARADRERREGQFGAALATHRQIQEAYLQAREEVADDLARIDGERESARLAAIETQRQRAAAEEAERQRLANEEAERLRQEAEQAERQRLAAEAAEAERQRVAAEDAERARLAAEEAERQRIAAAEKAKLDALVAKFNLVEIPAGSFQMGSNSGDSSETPVHEVTLRSFMIMAHEVTFDLFDECRAAGACSSDTVGFANSAGWGRGTRPAVNVNWHDVQNYISWLNQVEGVNFRLPSEAEWEYAARARTTSTYPWGDKWDCTLANGSNLILSCNGQTFPVKSFLPNAWGLYDTQGNALEWVEDCWHPTYNGAPTDGSAWTTGGDCSKRVLRGGSWRVTGQGLTSSYRFKQDMKPMAFNNDLGFRLVLELAQ